MTQQIVLVQKLGVLVIRKFQEAEMGRSSFEAPPCSKEADFEVMLKSV